MPAVRLAARRPVATAWTRRASSASVPPLGAQEQASGVRLKHEAAGQGQQHAVKEDPQQAQRDAACRRQLLEVGGADEGEELRVDGVRACCCQHLPAEPHLLWGWARAGRGSELGHLMDASLEAAHAECRLVQRGTCRSRPHPRSRHIAPPRASTPSTHLEGQAHNRQPAVGLQVERRAEGVPIHEVEVVANGCHEACRGVMGRGGAALVSGWQVHMFVALYVFWFMAAQPSLPMAQGGGAPRNKQAASSAHPAPPVLYPPPPKTNSYGYL